MISDFDELNLLINRDYPYDWLESDASRASPAFRPGHLPIEQVEATAQQTVEFELYQKTIADFTPAQRMMLYMAWKNYGVKMANVPADHNNSFVAVREGSSIVEYYGQYGWVILELRRLFS